MTCHLTILHTHEMMIRSIRFIKIKSHRILHHAVMCGARNTQLILLSEILVKYCQFGVSPVNHSGCMPYEEIKDAS